MNVIAEILGSYWLALIFQTSHVISDVSIAAAVYCRVVWLPWLLHLQVEWPKPDKDNVVHMDW